MLNVNARNVATLKLTAKMSAICEKVSIYCTSSGERSFDFSGQQLLGFNFKVRKKENMKVV